MLHISQDITLCTHCAMSVKHKCMHIIMTLCENAPGVENVTIANTLGYNI